MATVILRKDHHAHGKAGVPISVPYRVAQDLFASGQADPWVDPKAVSRPVAKEQPDKSAKKVADLEAELVAEKQAAEKQAAENKALHEQIAALKAAAGKK